MAVMTKRSTQWRHYFRLNHHLEICRHERGVPHGDLPTSTTTKASQATSADLGDF